MANSKTSSTFCRKRQIQSRWAQNRWFLFLPYMGQQVTPAALRNQWSLLKLNRWMPSIGRRRWVASWTSFQDRWIESYLKNIWWSHDSKWIFSTSSLNDTPYDWIQKIRHSTETFSSVEEVCWSRDHTCFLNGLSQAFFMSRFDMSSWFHACPLGTRWRWNLGIHEFPFSFFCVSFSSHGCHRHTLDMGRLPSCEWKQSN